MNKPKPDSYTSLRKAHPQPLWPILLLLLAAGLCGVAAQWAWGEWQRIEVQPSSVELTATDIYLTNSAVQALFEATATAAALTGTPPYTPPP